MIRIADTKAWNDAFVGGSPTLPFHAGSVSSCTDSGRSASDRASVLYASTRTLPDVPTQRPSGSRKRGSTRSSVACASCVEQALGSDGAKRACVLGEEHVGRARVAFLGDCCRELGAVAVAHLDVDAGLLLELLEERLDDLLLATRVHDDGGVGGRRCLVLVVLAATGGCGQNE